MQNKDYETWKEEYLKNLADLNASLRIANAKKNYANSFLSNFESHNKSSSLRKKAIHKKDFEKDLDEAINQLRAERRDEHSQPPIAWVEQTTIFKNFNHKYTQSQHNSYKFWLLSPPPIGVLGTYVTGAIIDAASHNHNAIKAINDFFVNNAKEIGGSLASYYGILLLAYIVKSCMENKAAVLTQDSSDKLLIVSEEDAAP